MNAEELRRLSDKATPGPWEMSLDTEYGDYGSILSQGIEGIRSSDGSMVAAIHDDYGHDSGADVHLIVALVNAYRSNQLQVVERDRLARATEIIEDIAICFDENDDSQPLLDYLPTELSDRIAAFLNGSAIDSTTGDAE